MKAANSIYIIMVIVLGLGIWIILTFGASMRAPMDLAGKWELSPPGLEGAMQGQAATSMMVEQSGRFFEVQFENGPKVGLKLKNETDSESGATRLNLANGKWKMSFAGREGGDSYAVVVSGPQPKQSGTFAARRVVRTYPVTIKKGGGH